MGFKLCIIADDFTGAGDSAIQFRKSGYTPFLALNNWETGNGLSPYDVLVVSTDSRFMPPEDASSAVRKAVTSCRNIGAEGFFKKIDSTIRGNIPEEVAAVMEAGGYSCTLVAPAAPKNGRTVIGGNCLVDGKPLGTTGRSADPFTPVSSASITRLCERRFPDTTAQIDIQTVRKGSTAFIERLRELRGRGAEVVVADAETINDLRVAASAGAEEGLLFAGASGLAEALTGDPETAKGPAAFDQLQPGELLFVVGSVTETSKKQLRHLKESVSAEVLCLDSTAMLEHEEAELSRMLEAAKKISPTMPLLIETFEQDEDIERTMEHARSLGVSEKELGGRVSRFLGRLVTGLFDSRNIGAMFITGGDTAARVAESLQITGIELRDEVLPGIPLGIFETPYARQPVYIVSKAGGFGTEETLKQVYTLLCG